jgi:hypothetical protein
MIKTNKEIKEIDKGITEATKLAHKILAMLEVDGKIPKKALISILMILHMMLEKESKLIELDEQTMRCLAAFGITIEEPGNGN